MNDKNSTSPLTDDFFIVSSSFREKLKAGEEILLLSNEIIYILSQGYIYGTRFSPEFSDSIMEPRPPTRAC